MGLPIITADQRMREKKGVKLVLLGKSGIGKTSLLWTLPPDTTLFFDLEAGDLAIGDLAVDTIRPRTWQECRDFAALSAGLGDAMTQMIAQQRQRHRFERSRRRRNLREDVDAVDVLVDHPRDPADLPLRAAQPRQQRRLVVHIPVCHLVPPPTIYHTL